MGTSRSRRFLIRRAVGWPSGNDVRARGVAGCGLRGCALGAALPAPVASSSARNTSTPWATRRLARRRAREGSPPGTRTYSFAAALVARRLPERGEVAETSAFRFSAAVSAVRRAAVKCWTTPVLKVRSVPSTRRKSRPRDEACSKVFAIEPWAIGHDAP